MKPLDQSKVLATSEKLGDFDRASVGDILGAIRWVMRSGSADANTGFDDRTSGEAGNIKMSVGSSTEQGVTGKLSINLPADPGAASQEFMVTAESGEDLILISSDGKYGANQEKAVSIIEEGKLLESNKPSIIETPNQKTIDELCNYNDFHPSQIVKVLAYLATCDDNKKYPVLVSIRGDQEINDIKLSNKISQELKQSVLDIRTISNEDIKKQCINNIPFGFIGPDLSDNLLAESKEWEKKFIRIADNSAKNLKSFICGNNIDVSITDKSEILKQLQNLSLIHI